MNNLSLPYQFKLSTDVCQETSPALFLRHVVLVYRFTRFSGTCLSIQKAFDLNKSTVLHFKLWCFRVTGKLLLNLMDHTEVVRDLTFAPDGSLILVSASRDKTLRVWDLKDDGTHRTCSSAGDEQTLALLFYCYKVV